MYPDCYDYYPDDVDVDVDGPETETCPVCGNDLEHEDVGIGSYNYGSVYGYDSHIESWCPYCSKDLVEHIDIVEEYILAHAPKEIKASCGIILAELDNLLGVSKCEK